MAIVKDFGTLKTEMGLYLFHQRLINRYDSAINQFEAAANSRLRVRQMEAINIFQTATGSAPLPTDYLLWRTVLYVPGTDANATTECEIDYVHPAYLNDRGVQNSVRPVFTIENSEFKSSYIPVDPAIGIYRFHYYQKIPTLVTPTLDNAATNWLITEYPNAYIYGVLTELAAMQRNAEMAQLYKARRDEAFAEIIQLSALTTGAPSPQVRTAEYF